MADQKISQLGVATNPTGGELLAVVQSGTTKKVTVTNLLGITPDGAGNVGLGVTPSAWAIYKSIDLPAGGYVSSGGDWMEVMMNTYWSSGYKYKTNGFASHYLQQNGAHQWLTAPSGTAGAAISFTQAMTLDANGNLGVGTSTPNVRLEVANASTGVPIVRLSGFNDADNAAYGVLQFFNEDASGQGPNIAASIKALTAANGNGSGGALSLSTSTGSGSEGTEAAERMRVKPEGQVRFVPLSAAPTTNVENGDVYYNSTTNKLQVRAAGAWVDLH